MKMILGQILEGIYKFVVRRNRPIKFISKIVAFVGLKTLSRIRHFDITMDLSGKDYMMWYGMLLGFYERGTVSVCKKYLRPGMTVIDVGAHVGYYTRLFAQIVGPQGKVYAFEPHPNNFALLRRNVEAFKNVIPIQMTVSDRETDVVLYESSVGSGSHSLLPSRYPYVRRIPVKCTSLDSFLKDSQVNLVKIDVEGAEVEVLEGMKKIIACSENLALILEFYPSMLAARGLAPPKLLDTLAELGLKVYAIEDTGKLVPVESWGSHELFIGSIHKYVNLFVEKKESNYD